MKPPVVILGAGGHARVLIDALRLTSRSILGISDANSAKTGDTVMGIPVIGDDEAVLRYSPDEVELVNGIGSVASTFRRASIFAAFREKGYGFATVIHPSAVVAPDVALGAGVQVMAGAIIQTGARVSMNSIINTRASVDHDCVIGANVHLAPGVTLCGEVLVADNVHVGTGAVIIQGISVGRGSIVGAGSVVLRNVPEDVTIYGVPAREAKK